MHFVTSNELLFPHVSLDNDAKHIGYGTVYIKDESYSRMAAAVLQLGPGEGRVVGTFGAMYEEVSKARGGATEAIKEALTLSAADLEMVQADTAVDVEGSAAEIAQANAYNALLDARKYINSITLGSLTGADGKLGRMAKLSTWLGSHITALSREVPAFNRRTSMLAKLVEAKDGVTGLDDDELAEGVAAALAATSVAPSLMTLCELPGGPVARADMRAWLSSCGATTRMGRRRTSQRCSSRISRRQRQGASRSVRSWAATRQARA